MPTLESLQAEAEALLEQPMTASIADRYEWIIRETFRVLNFSRPEEVEP